MSTTASKLRMRSFMGSIRTLPADAADVAAEILEIVREIRNSSDAEPVYTEAASIGWNRYTATGVLEERWKAFLACSVCDSLFLL